MLRFSISDRLLFTHSKPFSVPASPAAEPGLSDPQLAAVLAQARTLAASGVDFFLLREPGLLTRDLAHLAHAVAGHFRAAASPTRLLLHSRPDIAVATRAPGVHLPSSPGQLSPGHIRELYQLAGLPNPVISLSCHTLDDIRRALPASPPSVYTSADVPDLLLFGPVFEKRVHGQLVQPGTGLDLLRGACQLASPTPVLALGGITQANTPACLKAGAAGVAAIRLFL